MLSTTLAFHFPHAEVQALARLEALPEAVAHPSRLAQEKARAPQDEDILSEATS